MPIMVHALLGVFTGISQLPQPVNGGALTDVCLSSKGKGWKNNIIDMMTEEEGGDGAKSLCHKVIVYTMDNVLIIE